MRRRRGKGTRVAAAAGEVRLSQHLENGREGGLRQVGLRDHVGVEEGQGEGGVGGGHHQPHRQDEQPALQDGQDDGVHQLVQDDEGLQQEEEGGAEEGEVEEGGGEDAGNLGRVRKK